MNDRDEPSRTLRVARPDDDRSRQGRAVLHQGLRLGNGALEESDAVHHVDREERADRWRDATAERRRPPHWLAYISCPNVDEIVQQAESLGAKVFVKPQDIPDVGRFAILADPQGAVFSAFASSNPPQPEEDPKVGEFSWHELATTDFEAGFRFYQTLFGWEKREDHDMGPMGVYRLFGRNGKEIGGMFNKPPEMASVPPHWLPYVMVDAASALVERVKANGGQVLNGPMEVPGGTWIAQCLDPQGRGVRRPLEEP